MVQSLAVPAQESIQVEQVEVEVHDRMKSQVRDFRLERGEQGLILRGRARTFYAKQMAQHWVMKLAPVSIQSNQIDVASSTPTAEGASTI